MKRTLSLTIALIVGFSAQAFAYHVGDVITSLKPLYGASWDSNAELWQVLNNEGFNALANDVCLDINDVDLNGNLGTLSGNYRVYENSFWQASGEYANELIAEVAGYKNSNSFGWYEKGYADKVGDSGETTWGKIFKGSDGKGDTATFSYSNEIGFWLKDPFGVYYFTNSDENSEDDLQAVTFYLGDYAGYGNEYLICFEDLDYSGHTDNDFQDMIVRLEDPTIPEPASLSLLGMGLLGLFGIKGRKFKREDEKI